MNKFINSLISSVFLLIMVSNASIAEERHAFYQVMNQSGVDVVTVVVSHRRADLGTHVDNFHSIKNNAGSSGGFTNYVTGAASDHDWWQVTWIDINGRIWQTSPENFRATADALETIGADAMGPTMAALVGSGGEFLGGPIGGIVAAKVGEKLGVELGHAIFNNKEGTVGYKQADLTSSDQHTKGSHPLKIFLRGKTVVWEFRSGDVSTGTTSKKIGT
jgi:hypothetical protein